MPIFSATWYCIETGLEWQQRNKGKKRNRQMLSKNNALHETALSSTFWVLHSSGFFFSYLSIFYAPPCSANQMKGSDKRFFFFFVWRSKLWTPLALCPSRRPESLFWPRQITQELTSGLISQSRETVKISLGSGNTWQPRSKRSVE